MTQPPQEKQPRPGSDPSQSKHLTEIELQFLELDALHESMEAHIAGARHWQMTSDEIYETAQRFRTHPHIERNEP